MSETSTKAKELFAAEARRELRDIIRRNGGVEVFFVGKVDDKGRITEIDAFAFGNEESVPAAVRQAQWGDVVVHNHPSGTLEPSLADISVSGELADLGVGSYIVDNDCSRVRVVVTPFSVEETQSIPFADTEAILGPDGPLARRIPDFEHRPQQLAMARAVNEAFNNDEVAVIEAGTGVGKSLAYLIPAILWAVRNRERVVISTNTINLQEQLIQKDLPAIREFTDLEFSAVLVKGRGNYASIRRARHAGQEADLFEEAESAQELDDITKWLEVTEDGSRSDLAFEPSENTWERVQSQMDNCLRVRCPHYQQCFFFKSRRAAARAQVLVTNHHLLMADLTLRRATNNESGMAILPPYKRVVIDEAHNLEEVATSYLGYQAGRLDVKRLLHRLFSSKRRNSGILAALAHRVVGLDREGGSGKIQDIHHLIWEDLIPRCAAFENELEGHCAEIYERLGPYLQAADAERNNGGVELRITAAVRESALWIETVAPRLRDLHLKASELAGALGGLLAKIKTLPDETVEGLYGNCMDVKSAQMRLAEKAVCYQKFTDDDAKPSSSTAYCRWISARRWSRDYLLNFCAAPLEIGAELKSALFDRVKTCVMTSATLAVGGEFDYFLRRIGVRPLIPNVEDGEAVDRGALSERLTLLQQDTPFDFERQAFVAVPTDIPEPNHVDFRAALEELILEAVALSQGRAFILFTSYRLLDQLHEALKEPIGKLGYQCLKQGAEARSRLLNRFRRDTHSVLFATSSFWEGVDVKGDALTLLILTRLPFRVPTEPILEARVEYLERHGRNSFQEFSVPQAVIRFKQGFGRLIRHKDDRGAVLIFDRRLVTKFYGRTFIKSLPTQKIVQAPRAEMFEALRAFLEAPREAL